MERFATNKNGNIDSGTEVLANNVVFMQQAKEDAISNLFGDLFVEGILNTGNEDTMFKLTANTDGTFNISQGIAYKQNVAVEPMIYERIAIIDDTEIYDATKPQQTTDDGTGNLVITPKSTGCKNIPIENADITYYVDLRYLSVCDNKDSNGDLINFSIAKNFDSTSTTQEKRFYKWIDGYQIVLVQSLQFVQGICLGTVSKNASNQVTIDYTSKTGPILIESSVFMDYFTSGSGITITEEEGRKQLAINVDNKTLEIEDNKVQITDDGLYSYTKFGVNSGFVDSDGSSNILTTTGIDIYLNSTANVPLTVSPAYNRQYTILPILDNYDYIDDAGTLIFSYYGETADGIYTICINNTDKDNNNEKLDKPKLEIMKKVYVSSAEPPAIKGNIWLDISVEPFKAKWYSGYAWVEYHGVPLGRANITDTTVNSVSSNSFAKRKERTISTKGIEFYKSDEDIINSAYITLDSNGYLNISDAIGFAFNGSGSIRADDSKFNIQYNSVQINDNPIPRLPDYGSKVSNFVSSNPNNNDTDSANAPSDGWVQIKRYVGSSGGDDAVFSINGKTLFSFASSDTIEVSGFYFVKKGWTIYVRRGFKADFYSCL